MDYPDEQLFQDLIVATSGQGEAVNESTERLISYANQFPVIASTRFLSLINVEGINSSILKQAITITKNTLTPTPSHPISLMRETFMSPEFAEQRAQIKSCCLSGIRCDDKMIRETSAIITERVFMLEMEEWSDLFDILIRLINESEDDETKLGAMLVFTYLLKSNLPKEAINSFQNELEESLRNLLITTSNPSVFSLASDVICLLIDVSDIYIEEKIGEIIVFLMTLIENEAIDQIPVFNILSSCLTNRYQFLTQQMIETVLPKISKCIESENQSYVYGALNTIKAISVRETKKNKGKESHRLSDFFIENNAAQLCELMMSFDDEEEPSEFDHSHPCFICEKIWTNWFAFNSEDAFSKATSLIGEMDMESWKSLFCVTQLINAMCSCESTNENKGIFEGYVNENLGFLIEIVQRGTSLSVYALVDMELAISNLRVWTKDNENVENIVKVIKDCLEASPEIVKECCTLIKVMSERDYRDDPESLCALIFSPCYEILNQFNSREDSGTEGILYSSYEAMCSLIEHCHLDVLNASCEDIYAQAMGFLASEEVTDDLRIFICYILRSMAIRGWQGVEEHASDIIRMMFAILDRKGTAYEEAMCVIGSVIMFVKSNPVVDEFVKPLMDYIWDALHSGSPTIIEQSVGCLGDMFRNNSDKLTEYTEEALLALKGIWEDVDIRTSTFISAIGCAGDILRNQESIDPEKANSISAVIVENIRSFEPNEDKMMIDESYMFYRTMLYTLTWILKKCDNEEWKGSVISSFQNVILSVSVTLTKIGLEFNSCWWMLELMHAFGEAYGRPGVRLIVKRETKDFIRYITKGKPVTGIGFHSIDAFIEKTKSVYSYLINL